MSYDKRIPKLEKIGCFYMQGNGDSGFSFFSRQPESEKVRDAQFLIFKESFKGPANKLMNGDVFIYNKGILWRLKK